MKGLKEFLELLKNDKGILAEVEKVQDDASKVVAIAKKHGYEFTEDEYNDLKMEAVAGGTEVVSQLMADVKSIGCIDPRLQEQIRSGWIRDEQELNNRMYEENRRKFLDSIRFNG